MPDRRGRRPLAVMLARWALLLAACVPLLAAFGAGSPDTPPPALRALVASVLALLAPLFWPGLVAGSLARNALRLGLWCTGALALAALTLWLLGRGAQGPAEIGAVGRVLMPLLLLGHLLTAALQAGLERRGPGPAAAAGAVVTLLALLGAAPLWLGPAAQLLSARHAGALDALVAASPVVHLAVASGLDILRGAWFYRHSNLASLPVNYPGLDSLTAGYALACAAGLALLAGALRQRVSNPSIA